MAIKIKSTESIKKMKIACKFASNVLDMITPYLKIGVSTNTLNDICHEYITKIQKAIPAPLNYLGYPKSICTSINEVVCHGIPGKDKLKNGDIINVDVTVNKDGYYGDTSKMFLIGEVSSKAAELVKITQECLYLAIKIIRPGLRTGDIGAVIQKYAENHGFSVVREYCGHGIGTNFHEEPQILHFGTQGTGIPLKAGMIFTIEPMINIGTYHTKVLNDGWTVVTADNQLSAQWEHTILVTESGYEVLTLRNKENIC